MIQPKEVQRKEEKERPQSRRELAIRGLIWTDIRPNRGIGNFNLVQSYVSYC